MRYFLMSLALFIAPSVVLAEDGGQQLIANQWAVVGPAGQIDAVIVTPTIEPGSVKPGDIKVMLASRDGKIYRARPFEESNRAFSFTGVPAGVYTLVAKGPGVVACYAMHLVDAADEGADADYEVLEIVGADISVENVRNAVIRYMPATGPKIADYEPEVGRKMVRSFGQPAMSRVSKAEGGLAGRIYRAGAEGESLGGGGLTNILVFQKGELVAQAVSSKDGLLSIAALPAGQYGVIAVGPEGLAITSFELVDELLTDQAGRADSDADGRLVALQQFETQPGLELQLAPLGLDSPVVQELIQEDGPSEDGAPPTEAPIGPSAPGGGGGGGGGGSAGGGSGIGLAGLGVGIAAAVGNDGGGGISTPPATSPITP